ncbi:MAG: hypothetical protein KF774_16380 [Planctomyces sp.]|nr:hypothetical protein [Planctomyces sp.]
MGRSKHRNRSHGSSSSTPSQAAQDAPAPSSNAAPDRANAPPAAQAAVIDAEAMDEPIATFDFDEPAPPASAPLADAELYELELLEKDEVISALTAQLEQAVEQLDRLYRQGAGRGGAMSASLPADFVDDQRATADRVNQWIDLWDESQPIDIWQRIEQQLAALTYQIQSGGFRMSEAPAAAESGGEGFDDETDCQPDAAPPVEDSWERAKQQLLGSMLGESATSAADHSEGGRETAEQARAPQPPIISQVGGAAEFPTAVDLENASRESLCEAIERRDRYISHLTQQLRAAEQRHPVDWDALASAPADLRTQLEELEARYHEHLRREECELALERARLAREQARLYQDRCRLEQQLRRHGLAQDEPTAEGESAAADERSWLKRFGRKK